MTSKSKNLNLGDTITPRELVLASLLVAISWNRVYHRKLNHILNAVVDTFVLVLVISWLVAITGTIFQSFPGAKQQILNLGNQGI